MCAATIVLPEPKNKNRLWTLRVISKEDIRSAFFWQERELKAMYIKLKSYF